jgi:hypothetical protein
LPPWSSIVVGDVLGAVGPGVVTLADGGGVGVVVRPSAAVVGTVAVVGIVGVVGAGTDSMVEGARSAGGTRTFDPSPESVEAKAAPATSTTAVTAMATTPP